MMFTKYELVVIQNSLCRQIAFYSDKEAELRKSGYSNESLVPIYERLKKTAIEVRQKIELELENY